MKEQENSPEELNEMEASNLSGIEFKDYKNAQQHEERSRNHKKGQSEKKNAVSEINNTWERINSRLGEVEDQVSDLEDKVEKKYPSRKRNFLKNESLRTFGTT